MKNRKNIFERIPGGDRVMDLILDNKLTQSEGIKMLKDLVGDVEIKGLSHNNVSQTISAEKRRRLRIDIEMSNSNLIRGEVAEDIKSYHKQQVVTIEDKLRKIGKNEVLSNEGSSKGMIVKVDPLLGLHGLVADVVSIMHDNVMTMDQNIKYIMLKAKLFEMISKAEDNMPLTIDIDKLKSRSDKVSMFVFDISVRVNQLIGDICEDMTDRYDNDMVDEFKSELIRRLNIDKLYLDFIDNLDD